MGKCTLGKRRGARVLDEEGLSCRRHDPQDATRHALSAVGAAGEQVFDLSHDAVTNQ